MRASGSWLLVAALGLSACRDDAVAAGSGGTETGSSTSGTTTTTTAEPPSVDGTAGGCQRDEDCDDGDPCTTDVCDAGVCTTEGVELTNECRPIIDVEYPARGATLRSASPQVTVTGRVGSEAGAIQWLRINGQEVPVAEDGRFSHDIVAQTGGNILVLETEDEHQVQRRRVQSFLWSTHYHLPSEGDDGMLDEGLAVYLDQESLDDGDSSLPIDDLATMMGVTVSALDLSALIDPTVPVVEDAAGYDVYVTDIRFDSSSVSLTAIDGGMRMVATLSDVQGDLTYDGFSGGPGGFSVDSITATVDLILDVDEDHALAIAVVDPQTSVSGLDLWADDWFLDTLIGAAELFIGASIESDLEATLTDQLTTLLGPAVGLALGVMAPNMTLEFARFDAAKDPIQVPLRTDFERVEFHDGAAPPEPSPPQGGLLMERGGAHALKPITPYSNLGVPDWAGCGKGAPPLPVPREAPLEILLTDDLLNQLLYGAWSGGMLEFEMPPAEDNLLFSDLEVRVSGMLAPTASDCGPDGQLRLHMGDIRIDGSLVFAKQPLTFVAYSSLEAELNVVTTETGISITLGEVERVETELTVTEDGGIEAEPVLAATLEAELVDGVLGAFAGGLGGIDLPQLDLSGALGLPPGTAAVQITAEEIERAPGVTVVRGHL